MLPELLKCIVIIYQFPRAAVTKYHELGAFRQQTYFLWSFGRLEV